MKTLVLVLILAVTIFAEPFAVNFEGRLRPENSFAAAVSDRLCEKKKCAGIPAESLVREIRQGSADSLEVFRVNRSAAVEILKLDENRRQFRRSDFDDCRSLLRQYAEREDERPLTREFVRLNSALDLYDSLQSETFWNGISLAPEEIMPETRARILAESLYVKVNLPFACWVLLCFSFGAFFISGLIRGGQRLRRLGTIVQILANVSMVAVLVWRGIVADRIPVVSLYEIVLLLSWGISSVCILLSLKGKSREIVAGFSALVLLLHLLLRAALSHGDPFGAVSPLLDSPFWLSLHVFTIAAGFCALLVSAVVAHVALFGRLRGMCPSGPLKRLLRGTLHVGFFLSAAGTLLGGFWADAAWGRFWGFDPKENAALMVLVWCLIPMHLKSGETREKTFETLIALLIPVIAFCLFGVNMLGVGLHSYGYSPGMLAGFVVGCSLDLILVGWLWLRKI